MHNALCCMTKIFLCSGPQICTSVALSVNYGHEARLFFSLIWLWWQLAGIASAEIYKRVLWVNMDGRGANAHTS